MTGAPLFDFRLVKVHGRVLPGDIAAPMQPHARAAAALRAAGFHRSRSPRRPPRRSAAALPVFQRANSGTYPSIEEAKPTLLFNIHGGAEWTGAAADPRNGRLYVTSNEIPWFVTCFRDIDPEPLKPPTEGEKVYQTICFALPRRRPQRHRPRASAARRAAAAHRRGNPRRSSKTAKAPCRRCRSSPRSN